MDDLESIERQLKEMADLLFPDKTSRMFRRMATVGVVEFITIHVENPDETPVAVFQREIDKTWISRLFPNFSETAQKGTNLQEAIRNSILAECASLQKHQDYLVSLNTDLWMKAKNAK